MPPDEGLLFLAFASLSVISSSSKIGSKSSLSFGSRIAPLRGPPSLARKRLSMAPRITCLATNHFLPDSANR